MIKVKLVNYTPDPELSVVVAAKTCVNNLDYENMRTQLSPKNIQRTLRIIIKKNHHSPLEHVNFTFAISGVSRVFTHQLVRHRIASYSQLSQQRTDSSRLEFTIPPEIHRDAKLCEEYLDLMRQCQQLYKHFIQSGISMGSSRYVLPSAFNTRIVTTINARSLFNMLTQRECEMEEWEFREVASLMHNELMSVAPNIFKFAGPPCEIQRYCPEGEKGLKCSHYKQIVSLSADYREQVKAQLIKA